MPVDPHQALTRVLALPIAEWSYTRELADGVRHVSPIAEDFYRVFGLGYSEKLLAAADVAGVALAAIQGLHENEARDAALANLEARLEKLEAQLR